MFKKASFIYFKVLLSICCCFIIFVQSYAYSPADSSDENSFDVSGKFRVELSLIGGSGFKKFDVGKTMEDEIVTISPGGGFGGKLSLGYCITSSFNINVEFGGQSGGLSKKVENAKGSYSRTYFLGTLRYRIPITDVSSINIGSGAGYYTSGKLDVDMSKVEGGAHNIYEYKNTTGINVFCEYEHLIPSFSFLDAIWSWSVSLKYYNLTYKLDKVTSDGKSIQLTSLPASLQNESKEIDGSGLDIIFSIIMNL